MANAFVSRSLDEIRFWSRIMKEHALFLSLGFNYNDSIQEAQQFINLFERIEEQVSCYSRSSDPQEMKNFNNQVYQAAASIWAYKRKVLGLVLRCEIRPLII